MKGDFEKHKLRSVEFCGNCKNTRYIGKFNKFSNTHDSYQECTEFGHTIARNGSMISISTCDLYKAVCIFKENKRNKYDMRNLFRQLLCNGCRK